MEAVLIKVVLVLFFVGLWLGSILLFTRGGRKTAPASDSPEHVAATGRQESAASDRPLPPRQQTQKVQTQKAI